MKLELAKLEAEKQHRMRYWFKGDKSPTKSGPRNGARTLYALPRKRSS